MNEPMHDLLAEAIDRRAHAFAEGRAFADAHERRVVRSIWGRRIAATVGTGVVAAALIGAAGYGVAALSGSRHDVAPGGSTPGVAHTSIGTDLIPFAMNDIPYPAGETDRIYVFYVTMGATDMIPFPASGIWYEGIPGLPSDAIIVSLNGDALGYDLTASGSTLTNSDVWPASTAEDIGSGHMFDVIGDVTSRSRWGLHFYAVDGTIVSIDEGQSRADAVEVTAMIGSDATTVNPAQPVMTALVPVPSSETIWPEGDTYRSYGFYATAGATDTIALPFPASGTWYPGVQEVPSDAVLVSVDGDVGGFDLVAPHTNIRQIWASSVRTNEGMPGGLDNADSQWHADIQGDAGQKATMQWDVIGDVTDHTQWGIHYYLVDGDIVTEGAGRTRADAIEVTAMFDPGSFALNP